ncbi:outer membrane protein assembly factor BamE [Candidatus Pelagibacter sp.]|nr:outer membrane protein assembly factor BamE [Candidatus Pelagibacter sp.]
MSKNHGFISLEKKFDKIILNKSNKNDLIANIGYPSFVSQFNENKWFYVERKLTNQSLFKFGVKKISKNNILVIELNNKGLVENKKMLRKNDMNNIKYVKKITQKDFEQDNTIYNIFSSLREKVNAPSRNKFKKD